MTLLDKILTWTQKSLRPWQQDAARRLFLQPGGLTEQDYRDLLALLKAANGLPNPDNLNTVPLAASHLPATKVGPEKVTLKAMRGLRYVNRIPQSETLTFSPQGLSVIYGGNGSGKSGYSRVLKCACRARDQTEKVLPDANDPTMSARIPEATFDFELGTTPKTVDWNAAGIPPEELSRLAVFDAHCARAYLTSEQDIAYLPYGLDVVENLANKVLPELAQRLDLEIAGIDVNTSAFDHLVGETTVGRLIGTLNRDTDLLHVKKLASLSEAEIDRISTLTKILTEADPIAKAKDMKLSVERLRGLAGRIDIATATITDAQIRRLQKLDAESAASSKAEELAAEQLRAGEPLLPGTGDMPWKTLFEAARKYSTEVAYPNCEFPHVKDGAVCPLCQQPVKVVADRLTRFSQFVANNTSKLADENKNRVASERKSLENAVLSLGFDRPLAAEIESLDPNLASSIRSYEKSLESRRSSILTAITGHSWDSLSPIQTSPRHRVRNLAAKQLRGARALEKLSDATKRKALEAERSELEARRLLKKSRDAVLELIGRMKTKAGLEACKKDLRTRAISDQAKLLASESVTTTLKSALEAEFRELGIDRIKIKLKQRPEKGRVWYRLVLDLPVSHKPENILSEGEQRAIALASFMPELKIAGHVDGIIFDDPVSSLDHWRRCNVAKRLVAEATHRQVIILTHDTAFLGQLQDEIESRLISATFQFLEWRSNTPGHVATGLPWEHQGYKERIDNHEKVQRALAHKPWPMYPNESEVAEIRHQYDRLRATIERVIQDVVFNGVIKRYRDWIRVDGLGQTIGFEPSEHLEFERLHKKCCGVVDAHDPSSAKNSPIPTPNDLGKDIEALKSVIQLIRNRRNV